MGMAADGKLLKTQEWGLGHNSEASGIEWEWITIQRSQGKSDECKWHAYNAWQMPQNREPKEQDKCQAINYTEIHNKLEEIFKIYSLGWKAHSSHWKTGTEHFTSDWKAT